MSFLKITYPAKRDFMVANFLNTKENIKQDSYSEKLGDISLQRELTKAYKPIIDSQSGITKELGTIKESTKATTEALRALPTSISTSMKAIQFPQYPSIEAYDDPVSDIRTLQLGEIATKYLKEYTSNAKSTDKIFGMRSEDGQFFIGDTPVSIEADDVTVKDKTYVGTAGLWELLTMAYPNRTIFDGNDLQNYAEILDVTNAMRQPNNPSRPKSSRSEKYNTIIKPIWEKLRPRSTSGKGIVVLPQDPNALVEMLSLRKASFKAGNTGVRNEIVGICDELLRQEAITTEGYKKLMIHY